MPPGGIVKDERCVRDGLGEMDPSEDGSTPSDVPVDCEGS